MSDFNNHHGGMVLVEGAIFGGHGQNSGKPKCVDLESGKILWQDRGPGGGSAAVLYADGRLYFRYDDGVVGLIDASRDGYKLRGRFQPQGGEGPAWAHPVIADGKLYLRRGDILGCHDVKDREWAGRSRSF